MSKEKKPRYSLLLRAPVSSLSGYGSHARDIAMALIKANKYDLYIDPCPWGTLPLTALDNELKSSEMIKAIIEKGGPKQQPDIFITLTIPNEFQRVGRLLNIGFTAGIEVDRVTPEWIAKGNEMDLIIVPSKHSATGFKRSNYTLFTDSTKQIVKQQLVFQQPINILFEGVDQNVYNTKPYKPIICPETNEPLNFPTDNNILFVGLWLKGGMKEDRKNVGQLVRLFLHNFSHRNDVGLILKTATGSNSIADREHLRRKIEEIRRNEGLEDSEAAPIYIVHGHLSDDEMANLYKHPQINGLVSLTHGEGYGRPLAEAAACGCYVAAPNWSGQVDFLDPRYSTLMDFNLVKIPKSIEWTGVIIGGSQWAEVNESEVRKAMSYIINKPAEVKELAAQQAAYIASKFNLLKMNGELIRMIDVAVKNKLENSKQTIGQINLPNLPILKKIAELPPPNQIENSSSGEDLPLKDVQGASI